MKKKRKSISYDEEKEQLKDLRDKILLNDLQTNGNYRLEELIQTLENTQKEWQEAILELKQEQEEYKNLISQVNKVKRMIIDDGLKSRISIFTKLKIGLLKYKRK